MDGFITALVASLIGAGATVAAVLIAENRQQARAARAERDMAAARLIVEVSNLRDRAVTSRGGRTGSIELWRLRNELFVSEPVLRGRPVYRAVADFHEAAIQYRSWVRANHNAANQDGTPQSRYLRTALDELDRFGDHVIRALQESQVDERYAPTSIPITPPPSRHAS